MATQRSEMQDARRKRSPDVAPETLLPEAFKASERELLGSLYHLLGNTEDARDALQEGFVRCWNHREQVAEIENLRAWIFRIVLNVGRDIRKSAWSRRRQSLPEEESLLPGGGDGRVEKDMAQREELAMVRQAIGDLRPEEQEVFLLRQNGELTYEEIAESTGVPVGTVKTRMRLALKRLREKLADGRRHPK